MELAQSHNSYKNKLQLGKSGTKLNDDNTTDKTCLLKKIKTSKNSISKGITFHNK
jgi:hypothetical protein